MREHRFLAEVLDDLETTMNWLDGRREGLGKEFEFEFLSAVQVARSRPDTFSADHTGYPLSSLSDSVRSCILLLTITSWWSVEYSWAGGANQSYAIADENLP